MKHILTILILTLLTFTASANNRIFNHLGAAGQQITFHIQPGYHLSTPGVDWFVLDRTIEDASGLIVSYTIKSNASPWMREANLSVQNPNAAPQTYHILQYGKGAVVSAASYSPDKVSGGIVTFFGEGLATGIATPQTTELPGILAGTSVTLIHEETRGKYECLLLYVSPTQINFLVPDNVPLGLITIAAASPLNIVSSTTIMRDIAPDLFSTSMTGTGKASYVVQYNFPDGTVQYKSNEEDVKIADAPTQTFLLLFGTGLRRNNPDLPDTAQINGIPVPVVYARGQNQYAGLDQLTLELPLSLQRMGRVTITAQIDGASTNPLEIVIQ